MIVFWLYLKDHYYNVPNGIQLFFAGTNASCEQFFCPDKGKSYLHILACLKLQPYTLNGAIKFVN